MFSFVEVMCLKDEVQGPSRPQRGPVKRPSNFLYLRVKSVIRRPHRDARTKFEPVMAMVELLCFSSCHELSVVITDVH